MPADIEQKLRKYLNLYWLRPEGGLLVTMKSQVFDDIPFTAPSIDISCGNGMFMFVHCGGDFHPDFDYYIATKAREFKHSKFIDIYDADDDSYQVQVTKKPDIQIDYGTDWKQGLVSKAAKLGLYKNVLQHDNDKGPLPLPDAHFATLYNNSVHWVRDVRSLLSEMHRLLQPGGTALLEVSTPHMLKTLDNIEPYLTKEAVAILNRRRREEALSLKNEFADWRDLVVEAGFKVVDARNVYPSQMLIDIWNIGLRPISHLLIQMAEALSREERARIKEEWVGIFYELCRPLLTLDYKPYSVEKAPYLLFVLTK